MSRPNAEDRDALNLLLDSESLSDWEAEFCESLKRWKWPWTVKQAEKFDEVCDKHFV